VQRYLVTLKSSVTDIAGTVAAEGTRYNLPDAAALKKGADKSLVTPGQFVASVPAPQYHGVSTDSNVDPGIPISVIDPGGPSVDYGACTYGPYNYAIYAFDPGQAYIELSGDGEIESLPEAGCGVGFQVRVLEHDCGFFGCSWDKVIGDSGTHQPYGTFWAQDAAGQCIPGTHNYKTVSDAYGLGGPVSTYSDEQESASVRFNC
jgi:hypothetical protein